MAPRPRAYGSLAVINQKTCYILYAKITGKDLLEEMDKIKKILEEKKNE